MKQKYISGGNPRTKEPATMMAEECRDGSISIAIIKGQTPEDWMNLSRFEAQSLALLLNNVLNAISVLANKELKNER